MTATHLAARAIVRIAPTDDAESARGFLQGLLTNDVSGDLPAYTALLSAQGKTMFDMIVWAAPDGALLLDCEANEADALVKRLSLYRLRRRLEIVRDDGMAVYWSPEAFADAVPDPRLAALGFRRVAALSEASSGDAAWLAHRLALGIAEGSAELGDILWLETNAAELGGVSFTKGCYVGQENTARMNWRQKVNRRLIVVPLTASQEKRRKIAYPDLGLAIDHLRVEDIAPDMAPAWLELESPA